MGENAIELAQQSGNQPSPAARRHTGSICDHFRMLCAPWSATSRFGNSSGVRRLTGSRAQSRIAAQFLRRAVADLDRRRAAELLTLAKRETKPPKARVLRPLGRGAVISAGYAIAEGAFTEGQHEPHADVPFLVECWADALAPEE